MNRTTLTLAMALVLGTAGMNAYAQATDGVKPPAGVSAGPCVQGICEYTLDNGMKVLLFADHSNPQTTVNLMYGVGSVQEGNGETGMAHLLEHLLFKGTPKNPAIPEAFKARGITYNATTSVDRTNYFGMFPANTETLNWLLGLEADRMVNSNIAKKDLDSEMTVVRNEMERNENSPINVTRERLMSTAYLWHNYGKSTIGARADVEKVQIPNLKAFYQNWYRPSNATLVIGGKFDPAAALAEVKKVFGGIKNPATPLPSYYTVEPTQDGERRVEVRRAGDIRLTMFGYHIPAITSADSAPLQVLGDILSYAPAGRLHKNLVETKVAVASGVYTDPSRDPSLALGYAVVSKDGDMAKAEAAFLAQLEDLAKTPVTQAELTDSLQRFESGFSRADEDANATALGLTESFAEGDWRLRFYQREAISKVTLDDVNRVAQKYFVKNNRTVATFVPEEQSKRAVIEPAPLAAEVLKAFKGKAAQSAGEDFDASPENIEKRAERYNITPTLKVVLLPKETRGDAAIATGKFRFGSADALMGSVNDNAMVGDMLMLGAKDLTRDQISKKLTELKAGGGVSGSGQGLSIAANAQRDTLIPTLELLANVAKSPTIPDGEFEQHRASMLTAMEMNRQEPQAVAGDAMAKYFDVWPKGHPSAYRTLDERIAAVKGLTPAGLRQFHKDFYGTAQGEIAVVGDFDPAAVKAALAAALPEWKTTKEYAPIATKHVDKPAVTEIINTPDKANAVVLARMNLSLNVDDAEYPALRVATNILGGGGLKSRLADRLRQNEGLSYTTGAQIQGDSSLVGRDDAGALIVYGITAPENTMKYVAGMREELAKWINEGVTQAEVDAAVSSILADRATNLGKDDSLAQILQDQAYESETMAEYAKRTAGYKSLKAADINAALKAKIDPSKLSVFIAGDKTKMPK